MTPQEIVNAYGAQLIGTYRARMLRRHDLLSDELTPYIREMLKKRAPKSYEEYERRITFLPTYQRVTHLHAADPYRAGVWYGIRDDRDLANAVIASWLHMPADAAANRWRTFINNLSINLWAKRSLLVTFAPQVNGSIQPRIVHPHSSAVIGDTYESDYYSTLAMAEAVIVSIVEQGQKRFRIWYRDRIVTTSEQGATLSEVPSNGVLPFVRVFAEPNDSDAYAPQTGEALVTSALQLAYGETELAVAVEFLDPVALLKGWSIKEPDIVISPFRPLPVNVNQSLDFVSPNPMIAAERRNQLISLYARLEANYNLQPGALSAQSDGALSGVARRIATEPLRAQRNNWKVIIATIDRFLLRSLGMLRNAPEDIDVYTELEQGYLDPTERKLDTEALDRGLISPIDLIAERDEITRESAAEAYTRNLTERDQAKNAQDPFFPRCLMLIDDLEKLLAERNALIDNALSKTLRRDLTYLLSRFSVLAIDFIQGKRLSAAQISALSTSAELLKLLSKAGSDRVIANLATRFAPIANKALQSAKLLQLTPRLDQKAVEALLSARVTVAIEASVAPLTTAVKRAWLESTFLGTSVKDAINDAIANTATPLEGIARTEIGTALNTVDRAITISSAGRDSVFVYIGPIDQRTRPTCRVASEYTWHREQIAKLDNGQMPNVMLTCGGWNCRHHWQPMSEKVARALNRPMASNATIATYNKAGER